MLAGAGDRQDIGTSPAHDFSYFAALCLWIVIYAAQ